MDGGCNTSFLMGSLTSQLLSEKAVPFILIPVPVCGWVGGWVIGLFGTSYWGAVAIDGPPSCNNLHLPSRDGTIPFTNMCSKEMKGQGRGEGGRQPHIDCHQQSRAGPLATASQAPPPGSCTPPTESASPAYAASDWVSAPQRSPSPADCPAPDHQLRWAWWRKPPGTRKTSLKVMRFNGMALLFVLGSFYC